jgi:hypothetical protein
MTTLLASIVIMLLVVAGMAIGVMFGRQPIKGSCGGLNNVGVDANCELCGGNPAKCEESSK